MFKKVNTELVLQKKKKQFDLKIHDKMFFHDNKSSYF